MKRASKILTYIIALQAAIVLTQLFMLVQERRVVVEAANVTETLELADLIDSQLIESQEAIIPAMLKDQEFTERDLAKVNAEVSELRAQWADAKDDREHLIKDKEILEEGVIQIQSSMKEIEHQGQGR